MATMLDWSQVKKKVSLFKSSLGLQKDSDAFIYYSIDRILKIDPGDIHACITEGGNDRGIDAVYIESSADKKTIHLFQMKYLSDFKNCDKNFPSNQTDKILSFLEDVLTKKEGLEETCNDLLYSKIENIWDSLEQEPYTFCIHLCTNGQKLISTYRESFIKSLKRYHTISLIEYDLESLAQIELGSYRTERLLNVRLFEGQNFEKTDGFVRGLIGTIRASDLIKFLDSERSPGQIDESLFEENIRLFLGEKNEVNSKIYNSALAENPTEFWYLNNGITIVCDSYKFQPVLANAPIQIKNPQIVNGGQTSYSLYEAYKKDIRKLEHVRVLIKVIESEDKNFRNKIAEATNSQTPIRSRDLRSNDNIQLKFEDTLKDFGYFYERKKNQYASKPYAQRLDALKIGQIVLSYYLKEPEKAKTASDRIFGEFYEFVFDPYYLTADKIIVCYKLYQEIEYRRTLAVQNMRSKLRSHYAEAWIIEGVFHVLYVTALLCERDGLALDDFDIAKEKIDEAIQTVGTYVKTQKGASAYRIFRTSGTKNLLRNYLAAKQIELPFPVASNG